MFLNEKHKYSNIPENVLKYIEELIKSRIFMSFIQNNFGN